MTVIIIVLQPLHVQQLITEAENHSQPLGKKALSALGTDSDLIKLS